MRNEELVGLVLTLVIGFFGVYGFIKDIFHGHVWWVVLDLCTSGGIAVIRGIGYFFGWIAY